MEAEQQEDQFEDALEVLPSAAVQGPDVPSLASPSGTIPTDTDSLASSPGGITETMTSADVKEALQNLGLGSIDVEYLVPELAEAQIDSDITELKQVIQRFMNSDFQVAEALFRAKYKRSLYCKFVTREHTCTNAQLSTY